MRALVQRVTQASVSVGGREHGRIGRGLLCLVGVQPTDDQSDIDWLARKICRLRIFADDAGQMNRSVQDIGGELLAVSQFTLYASTRKGNRPSFTAAAEPEIASPVFARLAASLSQLLGRQVPTGVFGAHMQVALINDGPVTVWLDSRATE